MPRGIPNTKKTTDPDPIIIMQPDGDAGHFNAYGLDLPDVIRALRLSLIHFAAQQAGVTTIEATISPRTAVLATPAARPAPARRPGRPKTKPAQRSSNGRRHVEPDDDELDEIDIEELMQP